MPRVPHNWTCRLLLPALPAVLTAALLTCAAVPIAHADPKRIYLANDDHTDYFWSGDDIQYRSAFLSMLDYYMTQAETTAYRAPDLRGRFNCDGSLWVWEYERNRTPAQFARLIDHLRAGDITMPLNVAALCYGGMPAEAVLRSMYYAGRLERRYNLRFPLVHAMENQTLPGGIASLWAGAGGAYSWRGVCGCATKTQWGNRPREFYRFLGPDSTGVWLKWNTKPGPGYVLGGYAEAWLTTDVVNYLDSDSQFLSRWPWPVSAAFGFGQDNLQTTSNQILNAATNLSNPDRRVIVSNQVDFFEDFVSHHGNEVPVFSGSFGNEWDLYSASMGAVTSAFKRGIEKLRTAEALATLASLRSPSFMTGRETKRDSAFLAAGLYYEHDWTADGPVARSRRAQWQRDMLTALDSYVNPLYDDGLAALGAAVARPAASERHAVFNPLSWVRTEAADLTVAMAAPFRIIDVTTGAEVRSQVIGPVAGGTRVRILAQNVPSVGYRVYEVQAGAGTTFPPAATVAGAAIDNGIYQVTLGTRGQITSVLDRKNANRQLVDGTAQGAIHDLGFGSGTVSVENSGPVSVTLKLATTSANPRHDTRITLYAGLDRIDVVSNVTENFSSNLAYKSKFALQSPTTRHEEIGMVAKVARAAKGGDYADDNTRTDWLTFNHFVDLSTPTYGVTLSNGDSPFFQAGNSSTTSLDDNSGTISAVVGMQVDGPDYGIASQGGDALFLNRFALRTHGAFDQAAAMRFALEHQNPLVAARLTGTTGTLPSASWSMVAVPDSNVLLWALKPSEEGIGAGIVARTWNLAETARTMTLSLPSLGIASAKRTTHLETDLQTVAAPAGALTELLRRQQMMTWRLTPISTAPLHVAIVLPAPGTLYAVGDSVRLQAAPDPRDPAGLVYRWEADLVDHGVVTPNLFVANGPSATLVPAPHGDGTQQRYDIRLILRDAGGALDTARVTILPGTKSNLTLSLPVVTPDPPRDTTHAVVSFRIRERGGVSAPVSRWMVTVDGAAIATGDTAVAANDSVQITRTLLLPAAGAHLLRAVVDTLGQVVETQENDNAAVRMLLVRESQPPAFVSGPSATLIASGARIAWTTSEPASGMILHGTTPALADTAFPGPAGTAHADTLPGIPGLRHYYRVAATDTAGNTAWSPIDSFTVAPAINTPPQAAIGWPQPPAFFAFGDSLHLSGTAEDAEDGPGALRHAWEVDFVRSGQPPVRFLTDSLLTTACVIPVQPDSFGLSCVVRWIVLDSHGLADTASVVLLPDRDLTPSILSTSPAPAQEGIILICSFWIRNLGRMPSPNAHWALMLGDQISAEGDVTLGALDSVAINHTYAAGSVGAGSHVLRVVVDSLGLVAERNETNNAVSQTLSIQPAAPVGVDPGSPRELRLSSPWPNPASQAVAFTLELPRAALVRWAIYDLQGREVWSESHARGAGVWTLRWNGASSGGRRLPPGVYHARFDVDDRSFRQRLVLQ